MENMPHEKNNWKTTDLNKLNYMDCVIKETLRLYPGVPLIARYLEEEVKINDGLILPNNTDTFIHIFDIHRNKEYWSEPEKFDPDRFLPENSVNRHPYAFVPFSAGKRNCIGE